jgi:transposase-like protein
VRKAGKYSERTKRATLARLERNGGNRHQTAKEMGIPPRTVSAWALRAEAKGELPTAAVQVETSNTPLDDQLERLARQMVAVTLEKLDDANLPQVVGALKMVLERLDQVKDDEEEAEGSEDIYEKLAHLIGRYAADGAALSASAASEEG